MCLFFSRYHYKCFPVSLKTLKYILMVQVQHLKCIHLFLYHFELKNILYAQRKFTAGAMRKIASHIRA